MSWALKKQLKYLAIVFGVFALLVFWIVYPIVFKAPTCIDNKQNGTETGIDCGGSSCTKICNAETAEPVTVWSRAFPVTANIYNLVAYIENPNISAAVVDIKYEFRIYDTNNKLIGRREGSTFIPPNQQFVVFEPRFSSGESDIKSISFEFLPPFVWQKKNPTINTLPIKATNIIFQQNSSPPSLNAQIKNDSIYDIPPFEIVAILYDIDNNAINVSKTEKAGLYSNSRTLVTFTWPEALRGVVVKQDILVQINPFKMSF